MSKPAGERFTLTIRALPSETPVAVRLRHVLKGMLRAWGFRCERIEQLPDASGENLAPIAAAGQGEGEQPPGEE